MTCDKKQRYGIKRGNGVPTIPVSSDHRNGDWIATDIYEGEQYQDIDTGVVYTRSGVNTTGLGSVPNEIIVLKLRVHQIGVNAPVIEPYFNPFNYTLTPIRDAAGLYRITGLTGEDMTNTLNRYELKWSSNGLVGGSTLDIFPASSDQVTLRTYDNTGTLADNIIAELSGPNAIWNVVTISRYKS